MTLGAGVVAPGDEVGAGAATVAAGGAVGCTEGWLGAFVSWPDGKKKAW